MVLAVVGVRAAYSPAHAPFSLSPFFFFSLPGGSEARSGDSAVTALECNSADGPSDR